MSNYNLLHWLGNLAEIVMPKSYILNAGLDGIGDHQQDLARLWQGGGNNLASSLTSGYRFSI